MSQPLKVLIGGVVLAVLGFAVGSTADADKGAAAAICYIGFGFIAYGGLWWLARGHIAEYRARKARKVPTS